MCKLNKNKIKKRVKITKITWSSMKRLTVIVGNDNIWI